MAEAKGSQILDVSWSPPDLGWVKLNSNSASRNNQSLAGCRRLCRGENGQWILGFICNLGKCSAIVAELWRALHALKMDWEMGFKQVILETDPRILLNLLFETHISFYKI